MELVIYGLAGIGLPLLLLPVIKSFGASISIDAANSQLIKLAAADNIDRAIKLCAAAPDASYLAIAKRMLIAAGAEAGPARAERAMAVFHSACAEVQARHKLPIILSLVAGAVGLIAVLLAVVLGKAPEMMPLFAISALDILAAIWTVRALSIRGISRAARALAAALGKA